MDSVKWQSIKNVMSAAFDLPAGERADFLAQVSDPEIRAEAEKLLHAYESADDFIEKPLFVAQGIVADESKDAYIGRQIQDYLILERIGQGGMGAVYLAERVNSDFRQKVALKLIKRGMDSEVILRRFARERRILSTLRHPNISQLLDGGISSDGLPFIVMEYVDGLPLIQFCRSRNLELKDRLEMFRQICSAVEYAHKNLIVHRDLKPSNIIVSEDRIPKLLDFGIAKLLSDEDAEATATQGRMFTPEYASPEQILGSETVTTVSDVYSLGVILYELLTDHRPFETRGKSYAEIVRSVCETEPPRPSAWMSRSAPETAGLTETASDDGTNDGEEPKGNPVSQVPNPKLLTGDLDNIILKALRKEPLERYGSVQQFSEDIWRFLSGLPVLARPQTVRYRFEKYVKRHRAGVIAALLVVISFVGGISVATWQAIVAQRERAKAEQRFNDVRQLANSVVFELHDSIQNLPGSTPARELLLSRALEYLDKLAAADSGDASLMLELAAAYDKIGDIQGGWRTSHLGKREEAEESYRKALSIRQKLVAAQPMDKEVRAGLARSYLKLSDLLSAQVRTTESLEMAGESFKIYRQLAEEYPNDTNMQLDLATSQTTLGAFLARSDRYDESVANLRGAISTLEALAARIPEDGRVNDQLASTYYSLGEASEGLRQDFALALECYRKALSLHERRLAVDSTNTEVRRNVGANSYAIAETLNNLGDHKRALESSQRALQIFSKLREDDPQNIEFKEVFAAVEIQYAGLLVKNGKPEVAIQILAKPLRTLSELVSESAGNEVLKFRMAMIFENLGRGYAGLAEKKPGRDSPENWRTARDYFQKSYDIYKGFRDEGKTTGSDALKVDEIGAEIAKCDEALKKKI